MSTSLIRQALYVVIASICCTSADARVVALLAPSQGQLPTDIGSDDTSKVSLADYAELGVEIITVHVEALADPVETLEQIRSLGSRAHLAISPGTPVSRIEPVLDACDGVLVMSVEPGYGGQAFEPQALDKLARLAALRREHGGRFRLGVDGGISTKTIAAAAAAGAELIVAGSAVIRAADYAHAISELESLARGAI